VPRIVQFDAGECGNVSESLAERLKARHISDTADVGRDGPGWSEELS
jgi:hypothetical protein